MAVGTQRGMGWRGGWATLLMIAMAWLAGNPAWGAARADGSAMGDISKEIYLFLDESGSIVGKGADSPHRKLAAMIRHLFDPEAGLLGPNDRIFIYPFSDRMRGAPNHPFSLKGGGQEKFIRQWESNDKAEIKTDFAPVLSALAGMKTGDAKKFKLIVIASDFIQNTRNRPCDAREESTKLMGAIAELGRAIGKGFQPPAQTSHLVLLTVHPNVELYGSKESRNCIEEFARDNPVPDAFKEAFNATVTDLASVSNDLSALSELLQKGISRPVVLMKDAYSFRKENDLVTQLTVAARNPNPHNVVVSHVWARFLPNDKPVALKTVETSVPPYNEAVAEVRVPIEPNVAFRIAELERFELVGVRQDPPPHPQLEGQQQPITVELSRKNLGVVKAQYRELWGPQRVEWVAATIEARGEPGAEAEVVFKVLPPGVKSDPLVKGVVPIKLGADGYGKVRRPLQLHLPEVTASTELLVEAVWASERREAQAPVTFGWLGRVVQFWDSALLAVVALVVWMVWRAMGGAGFSPAGGVALWVVAGCVGLSLVKSLGLGWGWKWLVTEVELAILFFTLWLGVWGALYLGLHWWLRFVLDGYLKGTSRVADRAVLGGQRWLFMWVGLVVGLVVALLLTSSVASLHLDAQVAQMHRGFFLSLMNSLGDLVWGN